MSLTLYCKKCKCDVPPAETCPHCGGKLNAGQLRAAWYIERTPAGDWMCWNSVMRILLPVVLLVFGLALVLEGIIGGAAELEQMLPGLLSAMLGLSACIIIVLLLVFILQGDDVLDCVADHRGIHVKQYLARPTHLKLLLRLKSPALMEASRDAGDMLLVSERSIAWKDIARVQLWPEKALVLFYAPSWWLRVYLPCTPFSWDDTLGIISDRLGGKKKVRLPRELILPAEGKKDTPPPTAKKKTGQTKRTGKTKAGQYDDIPPDMLADIMSMNAEEEKRVQND